MLSRGSRRAFCCIPFFFLFSKPLVPVPGWKTFSVVFFFFFFQSCVQNILYKAQFTDKQTASGNSTLQNFSEYHQLYSKVLEKQYQSQQNPHSEKNRTVFPAEQSQNPQVRRGMHSWKSSKQQFHRAASLNESEKLIAYYRRREDWSEMVWLLLQDAPPWNRALRAQ